MGQDIINPAPTWNRPPSSRGNVRVRERQTSEGVRTEPCLLAASRNDGLLSGRCPEEFPLPVPGGPRGGFPFLPLPPPPPPPPLPPPPPPPPSPLPPPSHLHSPHHLLSPLLLPLHTSA